MKQSYLLILALLLLNLQVIYSKEKVYNCNELNYCVRNYFPQIEDTFKVISSSFTENIENNSVDFSVKREDSNSIIKFSIQVYEGGIFRIKAKDSNGNTERFQVRNLYILPLLCSLQMKMMFIIIKHCFQLKTISK